MNKDDINTHFTDFFSESVKTKLENHQIPVDADLWEKIEQRIVLKKRRIIPVWLWIPVGSVAILALIFTFNLNHNSITNRQLSQIKSQTEKAGLSKVPYSANISYKTVSQEKIRAKSTQIIKKEEVIETYSENSPVISALKANDSLQVANVNTESKTKSVVSENKTTESKNETIINKSNKLLAIKDLNQNTTKKPTKSSDWEISAGVNSSNGAPTFNNGAYFVNNAHGYNTYVSNDQLTATALNSASYSRTNYSVPVSFGLLVRKSVYKNVALESGLVYTFLQTKLGYNPQILPDDQLNLHYLGIPLNIVLKLFNSPKWEVYLSGGGMVEKGVQSDFLKQTSTGSQLITSQIDGFQWSVNAAVGTSYKFHKNFGIFLEPKISYFFQNNQPISVRTDQPTTIGLTAGLRYEFN